MVSTLDILVDSVCWWTTLSISSWRSCFNAQLIGQQELTPTKRESNQDYWMDIDVDMSIGSQFEPPIEIGPNKGEADSSQKETGLKRKRRYKGLDVPTQRRQRRPLKEAASSRQSTRHDSPLPYSQDWSPPSDRTPPPRRPHTRCSRKSERSKISCSDYILVRSMFMILQAHASVVHVVDMSFSILRCLMSTSRISDRGVSTRLFFLPNFHEIIICLSVYLPELIHFFYKPRLLVTLGCTLRHYSDLEKIDKASENVDKEVIISIHVSFRDRADCLIWHFDKNGIYTVKSGKILVNLCCVLCEEEMETSAHALFCCKKVEEIWALAGLHTLPNNLNGLSCLDLLCWLSLNFKRKDLELVAMLSWGIWSNRNLILHNKQRKDNMALFCWIKDMLAEYQVPQGRSFIGVGAVIRNSDEGIVWALSKVKHGCFSVDACKAVALREGLELARQHGVSFSWVEVDTANVADAVNSPKSPAGVASFVFDDIIGLGKVVGVVKCQAISRSGNVWPITLLL
ncbi:hypothetical protein Dsin_000836 [Dipteronia sinensis]|uniref:RNase H type-1 domain-containing protein n=1 Tax=Dipteronia sinensis TaxID=43782 RepID=A0AAE0EJR3_9ROSI|nr:hypothetical protein Dsin_000836 [Dipteronia sinensis]